MTGSTVSKAHLLSELSDAHSTYLRAEAIITVAEEMKKRRSGGMLLLGSSLKDLRGEAKRAKRNLVAIAQRCLKSGIESNVVMPHLPD